jgi:hypothetical protein
MKSVTNPNNPAEDLSEPGISQDVIEAELEIQDWIRNIFNSNDELVATIERLRDAFCAQLTGNPTRDHDEMLAQVEAALQNAAKVKQVL